MIITLSSIETPVIDVVLSSPPVIGVVTPQPYVLDVIGLPGEQGPPGPAGPAGADGTIVHVGPTPPLDPSVNDLWVDTT